MSQEKTTDWKRNINIPNGLSVLRLLVIAPFVSFFMRDEYIWAALMLIVSGLSDMFDGMIARRFNQFTPLGEMLDPLADKLTQGAVVICLGIKFPAVIPLVVILVVKELAMLVASAVGLSFAVRPSRSPAVRDLPLTRGRTPACDGCAVQHAGQDGRSRFVHFLRHTHDDVMRMMPILLSGTIAASIVRTALSPLTDGSGTIDGIGAVTLIAAAMAIAFLCSLCSTSDAVIAASMTGVL